MLGREVVVMFGQTPFARLADGLPTEGTFFCADDEAVILKGSECPERPVPTDVQLLGGFANATGNAAIVSPVVPPYESEIERLRITRQAAPGGRVEQPVLEPDEAFDLAATLAHDAALLTALVASIAVSKRPR